MVHAAWRMCNVHVHVHVHDARRMCMCMAHGAHLERLVGSLSARVAIPLEGLPQVVRLVARGVGVDDVVAFRREGGVEKRRHLVCSQQLEVSNQW